MNLTLKKNLAYNLLFLAILGLGLRIAAIVYWQFDGLYGQDSYAYYRQAIAIHQNLPRGKPPPVDFFWPNGYPLLVAGAMAGWGETPRAAQLVSLIGGVLVMVGVYLWGREVAFGWREGDSKLTTRSFPSALLGGLIIAVAGQPILSSVVVMADMPALTWATLSAWLAMRLVRRNQGGVWAPWLSLGLFLGLAVITRWIYGILIPVVSLYLLAALKRRALRPLLLTYVTAAFVITPQVWLMQAPQGLAHSWLAGWRPGNFWTSEFNTIDGYANYVLPTGLFYAQPAGHPAYIFPLMGLTIPWGARRLWRHGDRAALLLLLTWAGTAYLFLGGIPYQNFRFGLTLYPPLVILAGLGATDLLNHYASPALGRAVVILSLIGMLAWTYPMLNNFLSVQNQDKQIARQVEQTLPAEAIVLTFGLTLTLQHYTRLDVRELFYQTPVSLTPLVLGQQPLYLLVDQHNLRVQWTGRAPQTNFLWLQRSARLIEAARFPPYVLYEVRLKR